MPISLADLRDMRTVTLSNGERYRFRWIDPSEIAELRAIQNADLDHREFLDQVFIVLIDDPQEAERYILRLSDDLLVEMTNKYLGLPSIQRNYNRHSLPSTTSNSLTEARSALVAHIDDETQRAEQLSRDVMQSVSNIVGNFGTAQFALSASPIWEHLNSVSSIGSAYTNLLDQYHFSTQDIVSPLIGSIDTNMIDLADSWIDTQSAISGFYDSALGDIASLSETVLTASGAVASIDLPSVTQGWVSLLDQGIFEHFEEIREEYRTAFLIEANLQLLNDFSESAIADIVDSAQFVPEQQRNAYVARRLHAFTSDPAFLENLSQELLEVRKVRPRSGILRDIHAAHAERRYHLSIPALLAQVEGLTAQFMAEMELIRWDRQDRKWYEVEPGTRRYRWIPVYKNCADTGRRKRVAVQGLGNLGQLFSKVNDDVLPNTLPHIKDDIRTFRNQVMHGTMTNYGSSRRSSVLLVMALLLVQQLRKLSQSS